MNDAPHIYVVLEKSHITKSTVDINLMVKNAHDSINFYSNLSHALNNQQIQNNEFNFRNLTIKFTDNGAKDESFYLAIRLENLLQVTESIKKSGIIPFREYKNLKGKHFTVLKDPDENYLEFSEELHS